MLIRKPNLKWQMEKMKSEGNKQKELAMQLAASEKKYDTVVKSMEKLQSQLFQVETQLQVKDQSLSEVTFYFHLSIILFDRLYFVKKKG